MTRYPWAGNIRELQNVLERAAVLTHDDIIRLENLPNTFAENYSGATVERTDAGSSFHAARDRHLVRVEKNLIQGYLIEAGGNVSKAALLANIPRRTFYRLLDKYGLNGRGIKALLKSNMSADV
jgi:DNA-binding NtrC family response regulator